MHVHIRNTTLSSRAELLLEARVDHVLLQCLVRVVHVVTPRGGRSSPLSVSVMLRTPHQTVPGNPELLLWGGVQTNRRNHINQTKNVDPTLRIQIFNSPN